MNRQILSTLALSVGILGLGAEARAQVKRSSGPASLSTPAPLKPAAAPATAGVPAQVAEAKGHTGLSIDLGIGLGGAHGQAGTATLRTRTTTEDVVDTDPSPKNASKVTSDVTSTTLGGGLGASYGIGLRWRSAEGWGSSLRVDGGWLASGTSTTALGNLGRTEKDGVASITTEGTKTTTKVLADRLNVSSLLAGVPGAAVALTLPVPLPADQQPAVGPVPTTTTFTGLGNLAQAAGTFAVRDGAVDNAGTTSTFKSTGGIAYRHAASLLINDMTAATSMAVMRRPDAEISLVGGLTMPMAVRSASFVQQTVDAAGKHAELSELDTRTTTADSTAKGSVLNGLNATSSVTVDTTEIMFGPLLGAEGHVALGSAATLYGQVGWAPALGGQGNSRTRSVESGVRRTVNTAEDGTVTSTEVTIANSVATETARGFLGQSAQGLVGLQVQLLGLDTFVETGARTYSFGTGPQTVWNVRGGAGLSF
ncbi:MAG: hypothetical protein VKP57_08730 [Candidatus Sericytochromatia bacterium]|nr:hypothetical protein [Candidatus Sericytochromatia bacterium]